MPRIPLLLAFAALAFASSSAADIVLNEALPAPSADWSGDARPSTVEDEWVELATVGPGPESLDSLFLATAGQPHQPRIALAGRLDPGAHLFVTGEHALDWQRSHGQPEAGLSLSDDGGAIALYRAEGSAVECVDVLAWKVASTDVSLGRWPDGTGGLLAFDALAPGGGSLQPTPGGENGGIAAPKILEVTCEPPSPTSAQPIRLRALAADADGIAEATLFLRVDDGPPQELSMARVDGAAERGTWEHVLPPQPAGRRLHWSVQVSDGALLARTNEASLVVAAAAVGVALNELLCDPPPDLDGDANGDGVRHSADDEFVELVNYGTSLVDLSAWSIADSTGVRHVFADGTSLAPGEFYVVFGGGSPTGLPSEATVASTGSLSLNNTADEVKLLDAAGVVQDAHAYGPEANADQSLIRLPDGDGPWTRPHDAGMAWNFSPGAPNGEPSSVGAASWARIKALYQE